MRSFSSLFQRSLQFVATPPDYIQELMDDAKANPYFAPGQIVAAYDDVAQGILIGYGRILSNEWSDSHESHLYTIEMRNGAVIQSASYLLRSAGPEEARGLRF